MKATVKMLVGWYYTGKAKLQQLTGIMGKLLPLWSISHRKLEI